MIHVETDKLKSLDTNLLNPHFSRTVFNRPQTIFIAPGYSLKRENFMETVVEAKYDYSDRLAQWDYDKNKRSMSAAKTKGFAPNSAAELEAYLQVYYEDSGLNLVHIQSGLNVGNGYPYRLYGYIRSSQ